MEFNGKNYTSHSDYGIDATKPHIRLSLRYYLQEFLEKEALSALALPQLLNDDEMKVLKEMQNRNVKEIIIERSDDQVKIKSTSGGIITGPKAQEIKRILGLKNYQRIILDTLDEKSFSFKKTNKRL